MAKSKKLSSLEVIGTSFAVSVSDVLLNFIVALVTSSAVMLSQALQGLSDVMTASFLYIGVKRSHSKADQDHPLGYGRELYFWALLAASFMFVGTGGASFYFGYQQFINREPIDYPALALIMLCFGFATNIYSLRKSINRLSQRDSLWNNIRYFFKSGMIETKSTLLVDSIGVFAAALGLISITAYLLSGEVKFDGIGAMAVGTTMMVGSIIILSDIRGLIVGHSVRPEVIAAINKAVLSVQGVKGVLSLQAMYIGSTRLFVIIEVHLIDDLTTDEVENIIDTIKVTTRNTVPEARHVQVEIETPASELFDNTA